MNLVMDTLRFLTVKAIRGRTWAGERVYDSPGEPSDLRMEKERAPFVAVYVDDADFDLLMEGSDLNSLYDAGGKVWLVVEVSVAGQGSDNPEIVDDSEADESLDRPKADRNVLAATDQGLEVMIGMMARQVVDALTSPTNPWAELWRTLAPERIKVEIRRGGSGLDPKQAGAIRFASRLMRFELGVMGEPVPGEAMSRPDGFWPKFLALAEPDVELGAVAAMVRSHIEGKAEEPWRTVQRGMTLTEAGVRGIGIGPVRADMEETPVLVSVDTTEGSANE